MSKVISTDARLLGSVMSPSSSKGPSDTDTSECAVTLICTSGGLRSCMRALPPASMMQDNGMFCHTIQHLDIPVATQLIVQTYVTCCLLCSPSLRRLYLTWHPGKVATNDPLHPGHKKSGW